MTTDNVAIVQGAFAQLMATGDVDAVAAGLRDDFVHHRSDGSVADKHEWLASVRIVPLAQMQVEVYHLLADGDFVVMHSRRWLDGAEPGIAVVDIWRIDDGLIAEGWEIIEPVADAAAHMVWWQPAPA